MLSSCSMHLPLRGGGGWAHKWIRRLSSTTSDASAGVQRINVWAMPRTCSTALMYSFAQRSDTHALDEPFYANYLVKTGEKRSYRDEVLKSQENDGAKVVANQILGPLPGGKSVLFAKNISKQIHGLDTGFLGKTKNVLLIRHPAEVAQSWREGHGSVSLRDIGYPELNDIYDELSKHQERVPVIMNSDLVSKPEGTLRALCSELGIEFDPAMLKWSKGPKPEDGVWAHVWYHSVHASTGFSEQSRTTRRVVPAELRSLVEEAIPYYERLASKRLYPAPVLPDSRNEDIFVHVGGKLLKRADAKVSVFDSIVQGGDGVWEGLRIYDGRIFALDEHLKRMHDSAKALKFERVPSKEEIKQAIFDTLEANGMRDESHIRLTLTRGPKVSSGMSPFFNQSGCTLIVLAEWKKPVYDNASGIRLITASQRRNGPQCLDSKIHHNNLLNNILAKIEGNIAGVDDAIMLDPEGFVSETNATNIFIVRGNKVITPHADFCLPGVTRSMVIDICKKLDIPIEERRVSLTELQTADEVFTTGTMGELSPVVAVDARAIYQKQTKSSTSQSRSDASRSPSCKPPTKCSPPAPWVNSARCPAGLPKANKKLDIPIEERRVSLTELQTADEVFTTGTMGELSPVVEVDARPIGGTGFVDHAGRVRVQAAGPVTQRLQEAYTERTSKEGERLPF